MPEANAETFGLQDRTPTELEARRREIIAFLQTQPRGFDDPNVPLEILQELAAVTAILRRKSAGPPKVAKRASKTPATLDDLAF